ncbi:MAG: HNH endonuclease signature motif containing protein, partial [Geitlerinemataceae cyanobacterium]
MEFEEIYSFLNLTADRHTNYWDIHQLSQISNQRVPDFIMGGRGTLLRADIHLLWTQWFLESICDPDSFAKIEQSYGLILQYVKRHIPTIFSGLSQQDCKVLTKYIAGLLDREVQRRQSRTRPILSQDDKKDLWDIFSPEPRCWICGYKFTKWSENRFLGYDRETEPPLPQFIDYMTLHGLKPRDLTIEVDHAVPFSQGGLEGDNLRLACGWCNSHKSDRI